MRFFSYFRRKKQTAAQKAVDKNSDNASVARSVLSFISLGLTNGAESLPEQYNPKKITEFVDVSLKILDALRRGYEDDFAANFVTVSMKVNNNTKDIEMIQLGRDVMLSMNNSVEIINNIKLTELYANLRHNMIKHPEIYGEERQSTARSFPEVY